MLTAQATIKEAKKYANKEKAFILQRFFKTAPGQYGAGDIFWGLTVPQSRAIAKQATKLNLTEIKKLLNSKVHELRLIGLLILVEQFKQNPSEKIVNFYLKNTQHINNWDLVDLTASRILGMWLLDKNPKIIYQLIKSKNLWERRIAVIATLPFIKMRKFEHIIKLAEQLLKDKHDLMHKAVGWMLREMGKESTAELINFLDKNATQMPRTMLRYSIERLPEKQRKYYLNKKI